MYNSETIADLMFTPAAVILTLRTQTSGKILTTNNYSSTTMKRSGLRNPTLPVGRNRLGNIPLRRVLFESLYVVAACLLWSAILPSASLFCAGVDVYDQVTSPHWA